MKEGFLTLPSSIVLLGIHRDPKQKEFLKSSEGFLRAIPALSEKLPKWHFSTPACDLTFLGQMTSFEML